MTPLALLLAGLLLWSAPLSAASADEGSPVLQTCDALVGVDLAALRDAPSRVTAAHPAAGDKAACVVDGYTSPAVGWRLWLPHHWNGKLAQDGCGGRCGAQKDLSCERLASRGYACTAANLGVVGGNQDNVWALDNLAGQVDVGFRAQHVVNVVAREIVRLRYGRGPAHSYYLGISNAGRQGLTAAQRFPGDFDGVIVGEPAMRSTALSALPQIMTWAASLLAPNGEAAFTERQLQAVHAAVLAQCDLDDNLADGVISDPLRCAFDPGALQCPQATGRECLTVRQVEILRQLYAGQRSIDGKPVPGARFLPGVELRWIGPYLSRQGGAGRYGAREGDAAKPPYAFIFEDASNPDLRAFKASGGKMIVFQGWADEITPPEGAIDYYETVERVMGVRPQTQDFLRLFVVPGQGHTPGGPGAEAVDYLSYLEAWVEAGRAPDVLKAHHLRKPDDVFGALISPEDLQGSNVIFTRPVFPYPARARYDGHGDPADWNSFKAVLP